MKFSPALVLAAAVLLFAAGSQLPAERLLQNPGTYLPVHTALEGISVMTALAIFVLAWLERHRVTPLDAMLASGLLFVALVDLAHTISFQGMPAVVTPSGAEKAINFWLLARIGAAAMLMAAALGSWRDGEGRSALARGTALALGGAAAVWFLGLYRQDLFPRTFVPGEGLTAFKIDVEYAIVAAHAVAAVLLFAKARREPAQRWEWLGAASGVLAAGELFLTAYMSVTDLFNLFGHIYKSVSYCLVFFAIAPRLISLAPRSGRDRFLVSFQTRYIVVLIGLGVLGFSAHANLSSLILTQDHLAGDINQAGRQRMLLQRIDSLTLRYATAPLREDRIALRAEIEAAAGQLRDSMRFFESESFEHFDGGDVRRLLFGPDASLSSDLSSFLGRVGAFLSASPVEAPASGVPLRELKETTDDRLLADLDRLVGKLQRMSEELNDALLARSLGIAALTVVALFLSGFAVFRPALRKISDGLEQIRQTSDRLQSVFENSLDAIVTIDQNSRIIQFNPGAERIFGFAPAAALGANIADLIVPPHMRERHLNGIENYIRTGEAKVLGRRVELPAVHKTGTPLTVEMAMVSTSTSTDRLFTAFLRDITEQKRHESEIRKLSQAIENVTASIVITDLDGKIQYVNPHFEKLTGFSRAEVIGKNPRVLKSGDTSQEEYRVLWETIKSGRTWRGEFRNINKNGEPYWEDALISPIFDDKGDVSSFVAIKEDITAKKEAAQRLYRLAHYDTLTGLPNRLLVEEKLDQMLADAQARGEAVAVFTIGLDHFKFVNQSLGRAVGDLVLVSVARKLDGEYGDRAIVGRETGDHFAVALAVPGGPGEAAGFAEALMGKINGTEMLESHPVQIQCSVGVALSPESGSGASELIRNAEAALFKAKSDGRGRISVHSAQLNREAQDRVQMDVDIRRAIAAGEFFMLYQPQYAIADRRVIGMEALVRWKHKDLGLVSPGRFIPVAEASGAIRILGLHVFRLICRDIKAWRAAGLEVPVVGVNVSPIEFNHPLFVGTIEAAMADEGISGDSFEFEITEGALMKSEVETVARLNELKKTGARLSIDDFGTGYSSLQYLRQFPIDRVKIDQTFVRGLETDAGKAALCRAIVDMSRALGMSSIAEGVETGEQFEFLRGIGCDEAQGFLLARPTEKDAIARVLAPVAAQARAGDD